MRTLRYVLCDVFTDQVLSGNPLAVFTDASGLSPSTMQALARELNLSETVFLLPPQAGGQAKLRIFTPRCEIPFAGHPVLGTALVVGTTVQLDVLSLETGVGPIAVKLSREGARVVFGWMTQPNPEEVVVESESALLDALGLTGAACPPFAYQNGITHAFVLMDDAETVRRVAPNLQALAQLSPLSFSVVAKIDAGYMSRVFAPAAGVAEDPATGSAAGPLAWHLVRTGQLALGQELHILQGESLSRPSRLHARVLASADGSRAVQVGGSGVVVARGEFRIP